MNIMEACKRPSVSSYYSRNCRCSECKRLAKIYRDSRMSKRQEYESRPEIKAKRSTQNKQRWQNNRASLLQDRRSKAGKLSFLVNEIKIMRGCFDCGFDLDPLALQFDHVRGEKHKPIAALVHELNQNKLIEELDKCEVRCSNCHHIRTQERRKQNANL
jgi:hypothetical protein